MFGPVICAPRRSSGCCCQKCSLDAPFEILFYFVHRDQHVPAKKPDVLAVDPHVVAVVIEPLRIEKAAQAARDIGVPLSAPGSALGGLDSMLSTVQMPPGYPVATVALDGAGAKNAAWLAASILALGDAELAGRIRAAREGFASDVETAAAKLGSKL